MSEVLEAYVDESCQTAHRFLVMGGLACRPDRTADIETACARIREKHSLHGELKWSKVSRAKLPAYRDLSSYVLDRIAEGTVSFHCLVTDTSQFDHKRYSQGSKEIGFNKLVYQCLLHCFLRTYAPMYPRLHVYLDRRTTRHSTIELRGMLNKGAAKDWGIEGWPIRRLDFRDSKRCEMLQLNDVLLGCIGFRKNGHHMQPDASPNKIALAQHIESRLRVRDITAATPRYEQRFTVWDFRYKPRGGG